MPDRGVDRLVPLLGLKEGGMHRDSLLIIREMPLNREYRTIDYSRYAANTHSVRAAMHAFDFMIMDAIMRPRDPRTPFRRVFLEERLHEGGRLTLLWMAPRGRI